MRILHLTEALGGGITTAVLAMVESTGDIEHHLMSHPRGQHDVGIDPSRHFTSLSPMPANPVRAVLALRKAVRRIRPDVVHAHSSVAGVVARTAGLTGTPVMYSPHCFAFERKDVPGTRRRAFRAVERALVDRTALFGAVAPHELDLAAELGHEHLAYIPNRTRLRTVPAVRYDLPLRIAAVGRISPQKDWLHLIRLRRYLHTHLDVPTTWTWLGGGDPDDEAALRRAGVEVSGWLDHGELLGRLAQQNVYVHTAAWEAAPISILEAAQLGLPMAVRSIPSLDSLHVPGRRLGMQALADRVADLTMPTRWIRAQEESLRFAAQHDRERQREHLWAAYCAAAGETAGLVTHGGHPDVRATMARAS